MCITLFIILFISKKENVFSVKKFFLAMDNLLFIHKADFVRKNALKVILRFSTE